MNPPTLQLLGIKARKSVGSSQLCEDHDREDGFSQMYSLMSNIPAIIFDDQRCDNLTLHSDHISTFSYM